MYIVGEESGGFLCRLLLGLALGNLFQKGIAFRVELLNSGEGLEEPVLDVAVVGRIRVGVLTCFIQASQHQVFSRDGLLIVIVRGDVLLDVLEGQALVDGLRGLLGNSDNAEGGVGATGFLKLVVLGSAEPGSGLGDDLVHLDGVILGVDDDVSHYYSLSGLWCFPSPIE